MDGDEMVSYAKTLVEGARSDTVIVKRLTNGENSLLGGENSNEPVISYLLESEQPHYISKITPDTNAIKITGPDGTFESKPEEGYGIGGWFVVTDMRVLIIVNAPQDDDVISIPLSSFKDSPELNQVGVRIENNGLLNGTNLILETPEFKYELLRPHNLPNEALGFIRQESGKNQSDLEEIHYLTDRETIFICKQCKQDVPPDARKCPHCGYHPGGGGKGSLWHLSSVFVWPMAVKGAADEVRTRRGVAEEKTIVGETEMGDESGTDGPLEKIERLSELKDQGVISGEEFENKKAELLDDI